MHDGIQSFTTNAGARECHERRVLDLGDLSGQERIRALEAFAQLSPGGSLQIVAKRRLGQFVVELQARYAMHFDGWPLERGPLLWQAILAKPALGAPPTLATLMGADHRRLCELWAEFERALALGKIDCMRRRSAELSLGLRRYIDIEETILFPVLEAQTHMSAAGPTERMRAEHRGIRRIVDQLDNFGTTTDCAAIRKMFNRPVEPMTLFQRHCRGEEAVLYPFMEIVFNPAEERELLSLIQVFEI
jgi:uncharacterized protein (DUF2249 family)